MKVIEEADDELALFLAEIAEEEQRGEFDKILKSKVVRHLPIEMQIVTETVCKMVRQRNEMVQILREFLTLHPEDSALTRRTRRFTGRRT